MGCPSLCWLFDQPYSTGATQKAVSCVCAFRKQHNSSNNINNIISYNLQNPEPTVSEVLQGSYCIIPQLDSFILLCTYSIVGNEILHVKKKHITDVILLNRVLMYSVICGLWCQQKASLQSEAKENTILYD